MARGHGSDGRAARCWWVLLAPLLAVACGEATWEASAPPPLPPPTESAPGAEVRALPLRLDGSALRLRAELTQHAPDAPPVRVQLAADLDVAGRSAAGAPETVHVLHADVAPAMLASAFSMVAGATIGWQETAWPIDALGVLAEPVRLPAYLQHAPATARCRIARPGGSKIEILARATSGPATQIITYRSDPGEDADHRGEISGFLTLDGDGRPLDGRIQLRRWTKFDTPGCRLAQTETITIEVR